LQVKISVQDFIPYKFGKVPITVDASYTSGGEASGPATVSIGINGPNMFKKTVTINSGTATFELDIKNDLQLSAGHYRYYDANVVFEDSLTGNKVSDSKRFVIIPNTYSFRSKTESIAKPGSPLKFIIIMERYDGSPAPAGTKLRIEANKRSTIPSQNLTIGDDGTVTSSVDIPSDMSFFYMKIKANDAEDADLDVDLDVEPRRQRGSILLIDVLTPE